MVFENLSQIACGKVGNGRADGFECSIIGSEDRDVFDGVERLGQSGSADGTNGCAETCHGTGRGDVEGDGEEAVNDVDDTAREEYILDGC
jgi:hypothetical protein